jgi:serine protease Do
MTQTAKLTLTAAAAALLAAGATITTTASGWTLPAWLQKSEPVAAPLAGDATPAAAAPVATAAALAAPVPAMPAVAMPPAQVPNYRAIVQTQGPAVVGITVAGLHKVGNAERGSGARGDDDPFFRFFRGVPGLRMPPQFNPGPQPFRGQGSGFIISPDGLILTNAHVVREAKQVTVKLSDRREFSAQVLGSDTATDIAVLKVDAKNLPSVQIGDPKSVQVGDYVLAIGAPYGFEQTATQGIVSAKSRSLPGDSVVPFIQTDAAVNPGNSGGPLFDATGRVIGVNAQIYSQSGGFQGLAFSIPMDVALKVKDQIVAHGKVEHARLGVTLQDLSAPLASSFGLAAPDGALVASVVPDSAAAKAGLKAGDVITSVDGEPVRVAGDVSSRVGLARPGDKLKLDIWRDKRSHSETVTLGRADKDVQEASAEPQGAQLGLAMRPLERQELRGSGLEHGLLIERVGGPAQLAGVQPGDVLLALNGKPVRSVDEVRAAMKDSPKSVALLVARDGQQIFVPVRLG